MKQRPKARLVSRQRVILAPAAFADIVVWEIPKPVRGSTHKWKYRLALVVDEAPLLRHDNEAGKGDHKHLRGKESAYPFESLDKLLADFHREARRILDELRDS